MKYLLIFLFMFFNSFSYSQNSKDPNIYLWSNNKIPDELKPGGNDEIDLAKPITNISHPKLIVHRPEKANGVSVIVISGGGYGHIESRGEGLPTSKWLTSIGITAFELIYRLPKENWKSNEVPFQDAQRAIRIVRANAKLFDINPNKIGVLGFSAGGHLAAYISCKYDYPFYKAQDSIDQISAKPNFCGLLYPIISMLPPNNKTSSFKNLLGKDSTEKEQKLYSAQEQVTTDNPITFIAQSEDDKVSPIDNSLLMYKALKDHKIPTEMHLYQDGGHGWGMGRKMTNTTEWSQLFEKWLLLNKILDK